MKAIPRGNSCSHSIWHLAFVSLIFLFSAISTLVFTSTAHATTYVSGPISQNTTWTTAGSPYVLTGNVTVNAGYTLTVESGVVVKPRQTSTALIVNGTLNATDAIFSSYKDDANGGDTNGDGNASSPAPGDWKNINFATGSSGTISGCSILNGGYSYANTSEVNIAGGSVNITGNTISQSQTGGIYVSSGTASITNNTVSDNQGQYGIHSATRLAALYGNTISNNSNARAVYIPATLGQGTVYNNTYAGNKQNAMFLNGSVAVTENTVWPASNSPYVIGSNGNINIQSNAVLTIDSGVTVKFYTSSSINWDRLQVYTGSTLSATSVVFTSYYDDTHAGDTNGDGSATTPAPGNWGSIYLAGGSGTLSGCTISYGGGSQIAEIIADNSGSATITGSTISSSSSSGINANPGNLTIINNTISGNQGQYGISASTRPIALYGNTFSNNSNARAVYIPATLGQGAIYNNTYSGNKYNAMFLNDLPPILFTHQKGA
ncbi:MAG: right-handed parallel beta-helix repeat-containing protein [Thermoleophilia bacterium]